MKRTRLFILVISFLFLVGCEPIMECQENCEEHICEPGAWTLAKTPVCEELREMNQKCTICDKVLDTRIDEALPHVGAPYVIPSLGIDEVGYKEKYCSVCGDHLKTTEFANNAFTAHGKLSVVGPDLVDQYGEKYQLYGLSTHGLQWFSRYIKYNTFENLIDEFGLNVIRMALYTAENGYCDGPQVQKEHLLDCIKRGIDYAYELGIYVIIDWHMVGATSADDKNPLTYLEESKEFFSYISEYAKDKDNVLYEIMNEPNGPTTWADCKKYAEEVIPCIKKNNPDAIVLVGNPRWSADLNSVMNDPLVGYSNIMYTYHFYANDHRSTTQVTTAYDRGFPVFISEYGFMNSSGDGPIGYTPGSNWMTVLNARNISFVAWNISNSGGSASIIKTSLYYIDDFKNDNLKEWGVLLKSMHREKAKLQPK